MLKAFFDWLDDRTGLVAGVRQFLDEDIPASSGWHQVFGSTALFLLLVQFLTGALLAINYAAQPEAAYHSLRYIINEVAAGKLVRGLHHWGASAMLIVVVLHMIQAAIWGAYKKPREATWIAGVLLLLLTLAFGLTGYLLPWDNKAYWATVVTIQIASLAPLVGPHVASLLGSADGTVGVGTFQRFYALHTMVLPALTLGLAIFHVFLVRKHGIAPEPGDERRPKKRFYPIQVFKDTVAVFVAFAVLFLMALFVEAPLEKMADPTDTTYIPRPEWYFLFLFQTLKYFEGPLEVVGAVILPTVAVLTLAALPFLDRSKLQKAADRKTAIAIVAALAILWTGLTTAAIITTPAQKDESEIATAVHWGSLPPSEIAGYAYFQKYDCGSCHNLVSGEPKGGPALAALVGRKPQSWVEPHVKAPPDGGRNELSRVELESLLSFTSRVDPDAAEALEAAPDEAIFGAVVYQENQCSACHVANSEGQPLGPGLNGIVNRREDDWLAAHFRDPQSLAPGSTMPPYDFPDDEMAAIIRYMNGLP